jgi:hypothetical protein
MIGSLNGWSFPSSAVNSNNFLDSEGPKTLKFEASGIHFNIFATNMSS